MELDLAGESRLVLSTDPSETAQRLKDYAASNRHPVVDAPLSAGRPEAGGRFRAGGRPRCAN